MGVKITELTALSAAPDSSDVLAVVDISDTSMAASGTTKKITFANLISSISQVPSQTGHASKYLTTDGSTASWSTISSAHSTLTELDYASAGHTGFAGTGVANTFTVGGQAISNATASVVPLTITGAASQTANLQSWKNSAGNTLLAVGPLGGLDSQATYATATTNYGIRHRYTTSWTGAPATTYGLSVDITNSTTGSSSGTETIRALHGRISSAGSSSVTSGSVTVNLYGVQTEVNDNRTYSHTSGTVTVNRYLSNFSASTGSHTFNCAGGTVNYKVYGARLATGYSCTNTAGTVNLTTYGVHIDGASNAATTHAGYGVYVAHTGTDWTSYTGCHVQLPSNVSTSTGIVIRAASSGTLAADYLRCELSAGQKKFRITPEGYVETYRITSEGGVEIYCPGSTYVNGFSASNVGLIVTAAASQTANLVETQDSSSNPFLQQDCYGRLKLNLYSGNTNNNWPALDISYPDNIGQIGYAIRINSLNYGQGFLTWNSGSAVMNWAEAGITYYRNFAWTMTGPSGEGRYFHVSCPWSPTYDPSPSTYKHAFVVSGDIRPTANTALVAIGSALTSFDGTTSGYFTGSSNGTYIGLNAKTGFTGNLLDVQVAGVQRFAVDNSGATAVTLSSASSVGLTVKAATSQTANLTEWQNSSGTVLAKVGSNGNIYSAGTLYTNTWAGAGYLNGIALVADSGNPYSINGFSIGPSGNYFKSAYIVSSTGTPLGQSQWKCSFANNVNATYRSQVALHVYDYGADYSDGREAMRIVAQGTAAYVGIGETTPLAMLHVKNTNASDIGVIVKAAASQTANLQEWQKSDGTAPLVVKPNGAIYQFENIDDSASGTPGFRKYSRWLYGNIIEWFASGTGTNAFYINGDNGGYGRITISSSENYLTLRGGHSRAGGGSVAIIPYTADAVVCSIYGVTSQSANLLEFRDPTFATVYATYSENGYCTTRKNSAPADAELSAGECAYWFDSTDGAAKFKIKGKSADGTVVTGEVALA